MSTLVILQQMTVVFLLIAVGVYACRTEHVTTEGAKVLSWLVVNVTNPAIMISSVMEADRVVERSSLVFMFVVCFFLYVFLVVIGFLVPRLLGIEKNERKYYNSLIVYTNSGFMGIPVISAVLGSEAMIFIAIYNIFFSIFFYTHGILLLTPNEGEGEFSIQWKKIFNIGTISSIIAIVIFWYDIKLPAVLSSTLSYMGRSTTFLAMVVLGVSLAKISVKSLSKDLHLLIYSLVRMLVIPVAIGLVLKLFVKDALMLRSLILLVAMPGATLPIMVCSQNNQPTETLAKAVALTTLMSLVTVTAMSFLPI